MQKIILNSVLAAVMATGLSGCLATQAVMNYGNCRIERGCSSSKNHVLADDTYIAIGRPATPIAGYDRPLILAGKKSSIIIDMPEAEKDLLEKVMQEKHLLPHLNLSLTGGNDYPRTFDIKQGEKDVQGSVELFFIKPTKSFTNNERIALEKLGFERQNKAGKTCYDDNNMSYNCAEKVFYSKKMSVKMSVAGAVKNINQLTHTLKNPLNITIRQEQNNRTKAGIAEALWLPAMAIDLVTFPIQLAGLVVGGAVGGAIELGKDVKEMKNNQE